MNQYHECKEQDEWETVYKPNNEWVLRSDGGNMLINFCPYCGMKLTQNEESVSMINTYSEFKKLLDSDDNRMLTQEEVNVFVQSMRNKHLEWFKHLEDAYNNVVVSKNKEIIEIKEQRNEFEIKAAKAEMKMFEAWI